MLRSVLETVLKAQIRNALGIGGDYRIVLFISAKSAIYSFLKGLGNKHDAKVALVPDHVCSAVPLAALRSGMTIHSYPSGELMVPDEKELKSLIEGTSPQVLVLTPIFGAQGEKYSGLVRDLVGLENGPVVLLDQAQHMDPLPCEMDAVVISLHRKSIQGLNGGALLLNRSFKNLDLGPGRPISLGEEYYLTLLYRSMRKQRSKRNVEGKVRAGFYFEGCNYFPGKIENARMPLVSMVIAIFEMLRLDRYRRIRRANFKVIEGRVTRITGCHIVRTESVDSASLIGVIIEDDEALSRLATSLAEINVFVRRPYSRFDDPKSSARPRLFSIENPFERIKGT